MKYQSPLSLKSCLGTNLVLENPKGDVKINLFQYITFTLKKVLITPNQHFIDLIPNDWTYFMNITTPTRLMSFFSFPHDDSRISNSASLSVGSGNRAVFLKCLSLWETNTLDSKPPISDPKRMLRKCCRLLWGHICEAESDWLNRDHLNLYITYNGACPQKGTLLIHYWFQLSAAMKASDKVCNYISAVKSRSTFWGMLRTINW